MATDDAVELLTQYKRDVEKAGGAAQTEQYMEQVRDKRYCSRQETLDLAFFMITTLLTWLKKRNYQLDKFNRRFGHIQGLMFACGLRTINEMRIESTYMMRGR